MEYADWLVLARDDMPISAAGGIQPHLNHMDWEKGKSSCSDDQKIFLLQIERKEAGTQAMTLTQ